MSNIARLYTNALKKHFKVLYANWEPGGPIELGDYGIMENNIFIPMGKLKKDFPEFNGEVIQFMADPSRDQKEFKSERGVEVNLLGKGSVNSAGTTLAKATLEIKFSSSNSIFFNAAECVTTRISNKAKVGEILKRLLEEGRWKKEYAVVTDLVSAGQTLIAISQSNSSSIAFEAESPTIERINLADASLKLNLTSARSIGYKVDAKEGLNVLIGLCKIKNRFLWGAGDFEQKRFAMTQGMRFRIENAPEIKTEENMDELVFAQIGKD